MKKLTTVIVTILVMLTLTGFACYGQENTIYGCYKKNNGQLRIVHNTTECGPSENPVFWNQVGPPGVGLNPLQVALLRWYDANTTGISFSVGSAPQGIAFDGQNMWVASNANNDVTKLRASDGANLGTFTLGSSPYLLAFDGANIWVTNAGSGTVSRF